MKKLALIIALVFLINVPAYFSDEIVVKEGESIQECIDAAHDGDIIYVEEGLYYENLVINKSIMLIGRGKVVIDGKGEKVALIEGNGVIIKNITFTNSSDAIVEIDGRNAAILNCTIYKGKYGIAANDTKIIGCTIYGCGGGIVIKNNSIIQANYIYKCGLGIEVYGNNNIIKDNTIHTSGVGLYLQNATNNIIEKCSIYKNNNNQGGIFFLDSSSNLIKECNVSYGSFGIRMIESYNNSILDSTIFKSRYGIKMEKCRENEIKRCRITSNRFGITLENCRNIEIHYNDVAHSHIYSLNAKYSTADARHNWWGNVLPRKMHILLSRIKYFPWLITPLYEDVKTELKEAEETKVKETQRHQVPSKKMFPVKIDDFDPLVDIKVAIKIKRARSMEGEKNYEIKIFIDGMKNETRLKGDVMPDFTAWQNVDDSKQAVDIKFKVGFEIKQITYDLATGNWFGDDFLGDADGYGHTKLNGVEIWFDIFYNDYDKDGLTYWEEVNIYETDPMKSDYSKDYDKDGLPIEWEDKYGFSDFVVENHSIDYDNDGLNDYEEYYMADWLADPFAKDLFIEVDYMPGYELYEESIQMLYDAFARHNITLHIDVDEELPYMERVYYRTARDFYWEYFLHENVSNPRHGIFHYFILVSYGSSKRGGHAFVGWDNCDSVLLACDYINSWRIGEGRKKAYASLFMHELGHTLGLFDDDFGGIDNESCNVPWMKGYWIYRNYKSCMNYRYAFQLVDYSDGSHGRNDFDDWSNIDLTFFKDSFYYS